jgi:hypothetical protein
MIGALALVFAGVEAGFVGFGELRRGQICDVGDTVRYTVAWHCMPPSDRLIVAGSRNPLDAIREVRAGCQDRRVCGEALERSIRSRAYRAGVIMVALLGLHFTGDLDATGIATVLLAIATFALAFYTRHAVSQGAQELEQSQRPVLMPMTVSQAGERPWLSDDNKRYYLPVQNVGVGPAMAIEADIEFGDIAGQRSSAPPVAGRAQLTALGAGQETALEFDGVALASAMGFVFNVQYYDVSRKPWFIRGRYSEAEHRFSEVETMPRNLSEADRLRLMPRHGHA